MTERSVLEMASVAEQIQEIRLLLLQLEQLSAKLNTVAMSVTESLREHNERPR